MFPTLLVSKLYLWPKWILIIPSYLNITYYALLHLPVYKSKPGIQLFRSLLLKDLVKSKISFEWEGYLPLTEIMYLSISESSPLVQSLEECLSWCTWSLISHSLLYTFSLVHWSKLGNVFTGTLSFLGLFLWSCLNISLLPWGCL